MSSMTLVGYATRYGSTQEVAEEIAATLGEAGQEVELLPLHQVHSLEAYQAVVMGAPLFMFHWHKDALRFLARHQKALQERPVAVFVLGPTHEPYDEKEWQDSQDQLDLALAKFEWFKPRSVQMFGGKYDPTKLRFPLSLMAGEVPASDIRDWAAIRSWAVALKSILV